MLFMSLCTVGQCIAMVDYYKHAIDSIESVEKIAGRLIATPLQLNEQQCHLVVQELVETNIFLEKKNAYIRSHKVVQSIALFQLASAIKRAELFVKKCCHKDSESWLVAAMMLAEIQEDVATIILDIHLWRMLLDIATSSAPGLSHEQNAYKLMEMDKKYHGLFKKLHREYHALQQAALEDKRTMLSKIAEIHGSPNDMENLRAVYVQSLLTHTLVGTGNATSMVMKFNKYKIVHVLGKGACGTVFEVTWLGMRCALKILNLQDEREATALKGLYHPNIVRLFRYWEAGPSLDPKSHLLMELMPTYLGKYIEGRLKNMSFSTSQIGKDIMPFSLPVAIDIMEQVAQAVQYLHDRHLSHRDLKPSNILVKKRKKLGLASIDDEGYLDIKLADFGLAKVYNNTSTTQGHTLNTGTRVYGAPEIFGKDLGLERNFLPMADVWSFGMTCAEILSGKKPYADEPNDRTLQRRICKEGLRPTLPKHCPRYLAFCISCCWELRPERRPNFASICKLLRHAKLLSLGVIDLVNSKKFFAHTTRSGYVKSLTEPKSSIGKRFSTFLYTSLKSLGVKQVRHEGLPHKAESMMSNLLTSSQANILAGMQLLQEDCDVNEGGDPNIVIPNDASGDSSVKSLHDATQKPSTTEIVAVEPATLPSLTSTTITDNSPPLYTTSSAAVKEYSLVYSTPTKGAVKEYTLKEIFAMRDNLRHEIGRGEQGVVYFATALFERFVYRVLAVKKLPKARNVLLQNIDNWSGINRSQMVVEKEFWRELHAISEFHHRNLVALLGFCVDSEDDLYLVYEYMASGSLEQLLHPSNRDEAMTMGWKDRIKCAAEVAQGLAYLHSHARVHRNVKSGNILFDEDMQAKIANVGLSKPLAPSGHQTSVSTSVCGTHGYIDPVLLINGVPCVENDVYSYGVVLLELITGRCAIQDGAIDLMAWCKDFLDILELEDERVSRLLLPHMVDRRISASDYTSEQLYAVVKVAQMCVEARQEDRPTMKEVVALLHKVENSIDLGRSVHSANSRFFEELRGLHKESWPVNLRPYLSK